MLVEPLKNTGNGIAVPTRAELPADMGMSRENETDPKPAKEPPLDQLQALAADAQKNLKIMHNVDLQFSVHEASGRIMVIVRDESTGKVVREIPSREILNLAAKFDEMIGILLDRTG